MRKVFFGSEGIVLRALGNGQATELLRKNRVSLTQLGANEFTRIEDDSYLLRIGDQFVMLSFNVNEDNLTELPDWVLKDVDTVRVDTAVTNDNNAPLAFVEHREGRHKHFVLTTRTHPKPAEGAKLHPRAEVGVALVQVLESHPEGITWEDLLIRYPTLLEMYDFNSLRGTLGRYVRSKIITFKRIPSPEPKKTIKLFYLTQYAEEHTPKVKTNPTANIAALAEPEELDNTAFKLRSASSKPNRLQIGDYTVKG